MAYDIQGQKGFCLCASLHPKIGSPKKHHRMDSPPVGLSIIPVGLPVPITSQKTVRKTFGNSAQYSASVAAEDLSENLFCSRPTVKYSPSQKYVEGSAWPLAWLSI